MSLNIVPFVDEGLGHSSYLVDLGGGDALVIDPPRFTNDHEALARELGVTIRWTADTHSHADYVTGSPALAERGGAGFLAPAMSRLEIPHRPLADGEVVELAVDVTLEAIATPGHTPDHLAYLIRVDGTPEALFSGGSLMVGAVGRTDLLGADQAEPLARQLHRSLHDRVLCLPDTLAVYPTHGAGSFCSAPGGSARTTTIGAERVSNALLGLTDEDAFVETLLAGFGSFPTYFTRLPEVNRRGPRRYDEPPRLDRLDLKAFDAAIDEGAVVVDVRPLDAFAAGHIPGSISIALRPVFASWLGWLVDPDRPVVFVLDDDQSRTELVRQCFDVGHERLAGELDGGVAAWEAAGRSVSAIPIIGADTVDDTVIDVRQVAEYRSGHLPGARNIELGHVTETSVASEPMTLMCGHGERAMSAASILAATGHTDLRVLAGGPEDWVAATGNTLIVEP